MMFCFNVPLVRVTPILSPISRNGRSTINPKCHMNCSKIFTEIGFYPETSNLKTLEHYFFLEFEM